MNITYQLLQEHLVKGNLEPLNKIEIRIDQTLTQDTTGPMAYLQLEEMGIERVKTDLSVAYCDHQNIQSGFENADDHLYLQTVADKYGIVFSKVGNGICHQVHLERFAKPGVSLLGSDSHTPNAGGLGALAIGAGGLDVACAMAGRPFSLVVPEVIKIELINELQHGVSAKDVILHLLQVISVKGNVNKVLEYCGEGVKTLSVTQRATITNMGTETGVTTSIFPSDEITRAFLKSQGRENDYREIKASVDAVYAKELVVDLAAIVPLAACPHMPDNVSEVSKLENIKVDQVLVGSCTNSSYSDIMNVVNILRYNKVHPEVSFAVSCGSKNVLQMLSENGALAVLLDAGARILECACGPCIGMGLAPKSKGVSVRTFNRNFLGRSGTVDAQVYLVSPETAAATAIKGYLTSAVNIIYQETKAPEKMHINDSLLIKPSFTAEILRGPNIVKLPSNKAVKLPGEKTILLKLSDNVTTDDIIPAGNKVLTYRSNLPKISEFAFMQLTSDFYKKARDNGGGIIVAGENYGQGSSREHAAMIPKYLGIDVIVAKSFARIHLANLINCGVLPLIFADPADYDFLVEDEIVEINQEYGLKTAKREIRLLTPINEEELETVLMGGLLNRIKIESHRE